MLERRVIDAAGARHRAHQREFLHVPADPFRGPEVAELAHPARQRHVRHELVRIELETLGREPAAEFQGQLPELAGGPGAAVPEHLGAGPVADLVQVEGESGRLHLGGGVQGLPGRGIAHVAQEGERDVEVRRRHGPPVRELHRGAARLVEGLAGGRIGREREEEPGLLLALAEIVVGDRLRHGSKSAPAVVRRYRGFCRYLYLYTVFWKSQDNADEKPKTQPGRPSTSPSRAARTAWKRTESLSPLKRKCRAATLPSAQRQAIHTVPTGLSSVPPSGPAMPETATATWARLQWAAPSAISRTTASETAPFCSRVAALTPSMAALDSLL